VQSLPEGTPNNNPIAPQQPYLRWTPDPTKTMARRLVVGVENMGVW
jgi:hypothetical protein